MSISLQNDNITLSIDKPLKGYQASRFDGTGKILQLSYQGIAICGSEQIDPNKAIHGQGFYNEFGMLKAIGFEEIEEGDFFHKIGVGLLKKRDSWYQFQQAHEIKAAAFDLKQTEDQLSISCEGILHKGYGYQLQKTIQLLTNGFELTYQLHNSGNKTIETNEYMHNFLRVNQANIGKHTSIDFPFKIKPTELIENVNPEGLVGLNENHIYFQDGIDKDFYFSRLNGKNKVPALWTLHQVDQGLSITEKGSFECQMVNLWGNGHVISPELFVELKLKPGETKSWKRSIEIKAKL